MTVIEVAGQPHTSAWRTLAILLRTREWELTELARPDAHMLTFNASVTA
jgi:hypothetical protein